MEIAASIHLGRCICNRTDFQMLTEVALPLHSWQQMNTWSRHGACASATHLVVMLILAFLHPILPPSRCRCLPPLPVIFHLGLQPLPLVNGVGQLCEGVGKLAPWIAMDCWSGLGTAYFITS